MQRLSCTLTGPLHEQPFACASALLTNRWAALKVVNLQVALWFVDRTEAQAKSCPCRGPVTGTLHGQPFACACRPLTNCRAARNVDNLQATWWLVNGRQAQAKACSCRGPVSSEYSFYLTLIQWYILGVHKSRRINTQDRIIAFQGKCCRFLIFRKAVQYTVLWTCAILVTGSRKQVRIPWIPSLDKSLYIHGPLYNTRPYFCSFSLKNRRYTSISTLYRICILYTYFETFLPIFIININCSK